MATPEYRKYDSIQNQGIKCRRPETYFSEQNDGRGKLFFCNESLNSE